MFKNIDYSLYLVTDRGLCRGRELISVVLEAVKGGVNMVQLREKQASAGEFFQLARQLKKLLSELNVPLLINDRVDVALAVGADGVHIGQEDIPYPMVRSMLGPDRIIGISVNTDAQIREADQTDVDYLSVSPVFPTPTKADTKEPFGLEGLRRARSLTRKPLITIGGINKENMAEIISTGVDGAALVSAICSAASPYDSARELSEIINSAKQKLRN